MRGVAYALVCALSVGLFILGHDVATAARGYEAMGGEVFAFAIPMFALFAETAWRSR